MGETFRRCRTAEMRQTWNPRLIRSCLSVEEAHSRLASILEVPSGACWFVFHTHLQLTG